MDAVNFPDDLKSLALPTCFHSLPDFIPTFFSLKMHSTTTHDPYVTEGHDYSNKNDDADEEKENNEDDHDIDFDKTQKCRKLATNISQKRLQRC